VPMRSWKKNQRGRAESEEMGGRGNLSKKQGQGKIESIAIQGTQPAKGEKGKYALFLGHLEKTQETEKAKRRKPLPTWAGSFPSRLISSDNSGKLGEEKAPKRNLKV